MINFMDKLAGGVKMSGISKAEVEQLAVQARLKLTEEEKEVLVEQLNQMINFAQKISQLETENVPPTSHVISLVNVTREDQPHQSLPTEIALKNTAAHHDGQVKVPSILED